MSTWMGDISHCPPKVRFVDNQWLLRQEVFPRNKSLSSCPMPNIKPTNQIDTRNIAWTQ